MSHFISATANSQDAVGVRAEDSRVSCPCTAPSERVIPPPTPPSHKVRTSAEYSSLLPLRSVKDYCLEEVIPTNGTQPVEECCVSSDAERLAGFEEIVGISTANPSCVVDARSLL